MKIAIVGPVYPYRGGISHYTGLLCRSLRKVCEAKVFSYSMQYPKILMKREQKDYDNDSLRIGDAEFIIDTADPFNWGKSARKILEYAPDVVILQWWHPYFTPCYRALCRKLHGKCRILFLCHNVFPHERFPLDRFLTRSVLKRGDLFVVHSSTDEEDLRSIKKDAKILRTVLPVFDQFRMKDMSREEARDLLSIPQDGRVMLFFGFVREYKGLMHLIDALPLVREKTGDVRLIIAGEFGADKERYTGRIRELSVSDLVTVADGYIADGEVEKYFAASDVVVLPYESATQSGIVQMANSFGRPVIATRVGGLPEAVSDNVTGLIADTCDPSDIADKIILFFENDMASSLQDGIRAEAERFSWDTMVRNLTGFLEEER